MNQPAQASESSNKQDIGKIITNALRYWERLRIVYNLLLLGISLFYIAPAVWHKPEGIDLQSNLPALLLLAVVANILYCFAYIPDVFVQISSFREDWRRWRWLLFVLGCALAASFTSIIADSMAFSIKMHSW